MPKLSVHAIGRAIDLMVPMEAGDANNGLGDPVANWLVENAEFIGIQRVIWDKAYWNGERGFGLLSYYAADSVTANLVLSGLSADGKMCVFSMQEVDVVVDVAGYLSPDGPLSYQPLVPTRLLDTRSETSLYTNRLAAHQVIELPIQSLPNMPAGIWSVAANVTSVGATQNGFLSAFPCGGAVPQSSSLNFSADGATASLAVSSVGQDGKLCIFTSSRTHVIVDIVGVWTHIEALQPPAAPTEGNPNDEGDGVDPEDPRIGGPPVATNNGTVSNNGTNGPGTNHVNGGGNDLSDPQIQVSDDGCSAVDGTVGLMLF